MYVCKKLYYIKYKDPLSSENIICAPSYRQTDEHTHTHIHSSDL